MIKEEEKMKHKAKKQILSLLLAVGSLSRGNGDMGATRKTTRPVDEL